MLSTEQTALNSIGMSFVRLPAGAFLAGSPAGEKGRDCNEVQRLVSLTKAFQIQTTPVTQSQWRRVMGGNPAYFKDDEACPVEQVSWRDCHEFIRRLNDMEKHPGYRLPTEAEWEYACRAGSTTAYCFGDDDALLDEYAWHHANSGLRTHPVRHKLPNALGLYDMHGNVWEWCQDWYDRHSPEDAADPAGPQTGLSRVVRGGAWYFDLLECRSACRNFYPPARSEFFVGFRLVRQGDPA